MSETTSVFVTVPVIALIWITWHFVRRALSKDHPEVVYVATIIMADGVLVTLGWDFSTRYPSLEYVLYGFAVIFTGWAIWVHLRSSKLDSSFLGRYSFLIMLSFLPIALGLFGLFFSGVAFENYSLLLEYDCLREGVVHKPPPIGIYLVCVGLAVSLASILVGMYHLARIMRKG